MVQASKEITLFEFGFLAKDKEAENHPRVQKISAKSYDYLKSLCLADKKESRLFKLCSINGMKEVLQVQNYAGVIFTPDKTQIEVLPKIGKGFGDNEEGYQKARQSLLTMLRALKGFAHIQTTNANIASQKMPLLEVFIGQFLQSVNSLVKRGLRNEYVCQEDNLAFLKGKLNTGKQLNHNFINKQKFHCEYDEFLLDRPANRLIHSALTKVSKLTRSAVNQKLMQELEFVFHEIPLSTNHKLDLSSLKLDRGMSYYQASLEWSKLILEGFSPQTMKGDTHAASLLFPMEKVFEDYVAKVLKEQFAQTRPDLVVSAQATGKHLAIYKERGKFSLRPDLLIQRDSQNLVVLDTKWKLLDREIYNANISQSDVYQMFAYAKKYLDQSGDSIVLIYPMQDNFDEPLASFYDLGDNHKLWVVPFEISEVNSAIHWPENYDNDLKTQ
jgi:5-methylcytosine-specific restriction enzyme subunit McrC